LNHSQDNKKAINKKRKNAENGSMGGIDMAGKKTKKGTWWRLKFVNFELSPQVIFNCLKASKKEY